MNSEQLELLKSKLVDLLKTRYGLAIGAVALSLILVIAFVAVNPLAPPTAKHKSEKVIKIEGVSTILFAGAGCQCAPGYNPVCGNDNRTYYNECFAQCGNQTSFTYGTCTSPEIEICEGQVNLGEPCSGENQCNDGLACFRGTCIAQSCYVCDNGQIVSSAAQCPASQRPDCPDNGEPICTPDGRRFVNLCHALANGISETETQPCRNNCAQAGESCGGPTCVYASSPDTIYYPTDTCCGGLACSNGVCIQAPRCEPAEPTQLCTETDMGDDPNTIGQTTGALNGDIGTYTDRCGSSLEQIEYYCAFPGSENTVAFRTIQCTGICNQATGLCEQTQQVTCTETDAGVDPDNRGTITNSTGSFTDACAIQQFMSQSEGRSPGQVTYTEASEGTHVKEYSCPGEVQFTNCGVGRTCVNGACITLPPCEDFDGGQNLLNASSVVQRGVGIENFYYDVCGSAPSQVIEQYCDGNTARNATLSCPGATACSNGRCV